MPLTIGARLGPYEILSPLGKGGMGEVYRARDTKLGREVAIKILPDVFALDPDRSARFQREAQVLASINHPNIGGIHGLEETGPSAAGDSGVRALVLELIEGPTLAERLSTGAMPLNEAIPAARQIAAALQAAHDLDIIHRDLKPSNIKLRPDGAVKVLDFGLAKAVEPADSPAHAASTPTITSPAMTRAGVILGTAAYMSPEQARGGAVDKRSDVWAFGCVVYEMLAGRAPFDGGTVTDTLASVLKVEADWRRLPSGTPEAIRRMLRRCLQKDRNLRYREIADAAFELEDATIEPATLPAAAAPSIRERVAWALAISMAVVAAGVAWMLRPAPAPSEVRLEIATPSTAQPESFAIAPDGRKIVYAATADGRSQLWLRRLDDVTPHPLPGTEEGSRPFWSPDSQTVAFFAPGSMKRVEISGGSAQVMTTVLNGFGGEWASDDTIVFVPNAAPQGFLRMPASGGEPVVVATTRPQPQQNTQSSPQVLPGNRYLIYLVQGPLEIRGVYVAGLEDEAPARRLVDAERGVYAAGRLFFTRQNRLFVQPFDAASLRLSGVPEPVADGVGVFDVSDSGTVVYREGAAFASTIRQLRWLDRTGTNLGNVEGGDGLDAPSVSPDGRRIAAYLTTAGNVDVWVIEPRGIRTRFTAEPGVDNFPVWSPDGKFIAYSSTRMGGPHNLFRRPSAGGAEELLLATDEVKTVLDWSRDGRYILYRSAHPRNAHDLWALGLADRKAIPVAQTRFAERDGVFSPDGRWMAYQSDETGRFEVYVQAFPVPGQKWPISTAGGAQVRWGRDGKELFYVSPDDRLMAVPFSVAPDGQSVEAGTPAPLFATQVALSQGFLRQQYDLSPDGRRFLMNVLLSNAPTAPLVVILNPGRPVQQ